MRKCGVKRRIGIAAAVLLYAAAAVLVAVIVYSGGDYPSGSDAMCHVYKGDVLYRNILNGNLYPLYDGFWYNGVQMLRYWAPLPVYFLALCQALAGGDALSGYLVFVGFVLFLGALAWLYIGVKKNRVLLGAFIGLLWFFMPNNLYALFGEGNLPRALSMVLLPLFVYRVNAYLGEGDIKSVKHIIILFSGLVLCHSGYAGMIAIAMLIYLLVYKLLNHQIKRCIPVILSMLSGYAITGIWLFASLKGGIASTDSSQVMTGFFQSAWISLNPFYRYESGNVTFYFGLAAFVLAIFGAVCSHRKSMAGFISAVVIFLCTTTAALPVLRLLPGSQYLWMLRFISIALCFILYSFMEWDTLKKPFAAVICVLLVLDVIPSLSLVYTGNNGYTARERLADYSDSSLITEAKELTTQRMALLDESTMGATAPYLISDFGKKTATSFGAGWQSAVTTGNISMLNEALSDGDYLYLFDRCLELGNDTVLVKLSQLKNRESDAMELTEAAQAVGYRLVDNNGTFALYNIDTYDIFGVISDYRILGIGSSAELMSLKFPAIESADGSDIDAFTFDELKKYDVIYLDHFTYKDKSVAEKLITELSQSGVRVIINADGIPVNRSLNVAEFLGVTCSSIKFENGYPILYMGETELDCALFDKDYREWDTVYLNGLDKELGCFYDNNLKEAFLGTVKNDNIVFVGLNLGYHYVLTGDFTLDGLYEGLLGVSRSTLPERRLVPLTVNYAGNHITIESEYDGVNTTLAYHDIFKSGSSIYSKNSLMYVDGGRTDISMHYPYAAAGGIMTVIGLAGATAICVLLNKKMNNGQKLR